MVILSKFAENLKDLIFDSRINQKILSAETGIDKASVSRYVNGISIPNLKSTVLLADYFECSIDFLIGKSEENCHAGFRPCPPFSERLKYYLSIYNGSPYCLCRELGLPDNKFYGWRDGLCFPTVANVEKLADFFKCTVDGFLGREL